MGWRESLQEPRESQGGPCVPGAGTIPVAPAWSGFTLRDNGQQGQFRLVFAACFPQAEEANLALPGSDDKNLRF